MAYDADFDFDTLEIGGESEQELDFLNMEVSPEADFDLSDLSSVAYTPEVHVGVSMPSKSIELVAAEVEDTLVDLVARGDIQSVLVLTGQQRNDGSVMPEFEAEFKPMFAQALGHNPALRWYGRLASALPKRFSVKDNGLNVSMTHRAYSKCIAPFVGDLDPDRIASSPIAALMDSLIKSFRERSIAAQEKQVLEAQKSVDRREPDDFGAEGLEFPDDMEELTDLDARDAKYRVDRGPLGLDDFTEDNNVIQDTMVSFHDLSNKAISQYLFDKGTVDKTAIVEKLSTEGFKRARINEIMGIVGYMKLAKEGKGPQATRRRGGDVDFIKVEF